ncbi:MAG: NAD-dependent epimerase/dehydratase family protein [Ferruginibacter sp.]
MKKVLVTGASGFIGSFVVEELLRKGYNVIASSLDKDKASLKKWFHSVTYLAFDLHSLDNSINYFDFFGKPDMMIHLAWEGLPNYTNDFHLKENLPRHAAFLKNLLKHGLTDLTVTGTCLEYGMREGCLTEDMQADPSNAYAVAKNELRKQLEEGCAKDDISFKWIRLFYMYGEGQSPKSLISQLDKAIENKEPVFNMSGGEQVRDYLPVKKVAEYIVAIAAQTRVSGIVNCCSGNKITVKSFVENYLKEKTSKISLNPGYYSYTDYEPMEFWGDTKKLKTIIK